MVDCEAGDTLDISPSRPRFDADHLMDEALGRAGRQNFADMSFVEPLRRLIAAYDLEADLSRFGRHAARFDILRSLANILKLDAEEERDPSIARRPIPKPIFITGLPRSASTFLHTLIAQDPANAVPLGWQSLFPYPRPLFGLDLRRLKVEIDFALYRLLSPGVSALHPISTTSPQECTDITAQVFQSLRFDSTHHLPSYQSWLMAHGHLDAYRFHRRFLRHLDAQAPGRRWVLKSPDHVFALAAIARVYPDAGIVFLHRDPLSVVASSVKLNELLHKPFTRHVDKRELGSRVSESLIRAAQEMTRFGGHALLHMQFRDITARPMAAVARLYDACGLALSRDAERRMQAWLRRQRRRRHPRYRLEEFGLEAGALRERFADYIQAFAVPVEPGHP